MRYDPLVLDILFLLHIGKDWFLESKLSVVVPQAIGISLRNIRSLVLVSNISSVAWLGCNDRWCRSRLWLLGDWPYDAICSVGCPLCITVGGTRMGSVWNDSVQVSKLGINEIKLSGLQYGLFFILGMFKCDFLCDGWEKSLKEPIQEDHVV